MPFYEYECQACGLQFEKLKAMSRSEEPEKCTACASDQTRKLVSTTNFTFAHTPVGGARPQNTGVHSIDYNYDRVIGRDAEKRWEVIAQREKQKNGVLRDNPGATKADLSRTLEGEYRVMKPEERRAAETARKINKTAMDSKPQ